MSMHVSINYRTIDGEKKVVEISSSVPTDAMTDCLKVLCAGLNDVAFDEEELSDYLVSAKSVVSSINATMKNVAMFQILEDGMPALVDGKTFGRASIKQVKGVWTFSTENIRTKTVSGIGENGEEVKEKRYDTIGYSELLTFISKWNASEKTYAKKDGRKPISISFSDDFNREQKTVFSVIRDFIVDDVTESTLSRLGKLREMPFIGEYFQFDGEKPSNKKMIGMFSVLYAFIGARAGDDKPPKPIGAVVKRVRNQMTVSSSKYKTDTVLSTADFITFIMQEYKNSTLVAIKCNKEVKEQEQEQDTVKMLPAPVQEQEQEQEEKKVGGITRIKKS